MLNMATETLTPNIARNSERFDHRRGIDLWLRTWIALGVVVALTVVGYLILISSSLAGINSHLQIARTAVVDVNGNTKTLPGQISAVNENLTSIDKALKSIPSQASAIRDNLESVKEHGLVIDGSLSDTSGQLAAVARDLADSAPRLSRITSQLTDTSGLLASILKSTGSIDSNLQILKGNGSAGVGTTSAKVVSILNALKPTRLGLDDILSGLRSVDNHLYDVCRSPAINLLHGAQRC